jgi:hypothetical protein
MGEGRSGRTDVKTDMMRGSVAHDDSLFHARRCVAVGVSEAHQPFLGLLREASFS